MIKYKEDSMLVAPFSGSEKEKEADEYRHWVRLGEMDKPRLDAVEAIVCSHPDIAPKVGLAIAWGLETFHDAKKEEKGAIGVVVEKRFVMLTGWTKNETRKNGIHVPDLAIGNASPGTEVKHTSIQHGWLIAKENVGHDAILIYTNIPEMTAMVGLAVLRDEYLCEAGNNDGKRRLFEQAFRTRIRWVLHNIQIPRVGLQELMESHWQMCASRYAVPASTS